MDKRDGLRSLGFAEDTLADAGVMGVLNTRLFTTGVEGDAMEDDDEKEEEQDEATTDE